jgi:hypothetical protein
MKRCWLICAVVVIGLSGCKTAEQALLESGVKPMHEAQMREEFIGNTLYGETESGRRWIEYLDPNGTARTKWVANGATQKGTWSMKDFRSCFSYEGNNAGIPLCFTTYKNEDGVTAFNDGNNTKGQFGYRIYRIEAGNVEAL